MEAEKDCQAGDGRGDQERVKVTEKWRYRAEETQGWGLSDLDPLKPGGTDAPIKILEKANSYQSKNERPQPLRNLSALCASAINDTVHRITAALLTQTFVVNSPVMKIISLSREQFHKNHEEHL